MKTINLPSTKNGLNNLRALAKEVYGRDMAVETIYNDNGHKPNTYIVEGGNGAGKKAGELADLMISILVKRHGEVKINRGQWV